MTGNKKTGHSGRFSNGMKPKICICLNNRISLKTHNFRGKSFIISSILIDY